MSARRLVERKSLFAISLLPVMMAASGAAAQSASYLPTGGSVVSGTATINNQTPAGLTISQSSDKAIINWTSFSVNSSQEVRFNNGTGATLNRVTGTSVSEINGGLTATGSVYLLNPNGVIIGSGGAVNVGGTFVASTLDLTDANFLAGGDLVFSGNSNAAVVNFGSIGAVGGDIALIGYTVDNNNAAGDGGLTAANGTVGLIGGHRVLLRDALVNDGKFLVEVGAGGSVNNSGAVNAAAIELRTHGGNIYALAGNSSTILNATATQRIGGRIFLTDTGGGSIDTQSTITATPYGMGTSRVVMSADSVVLSGGDVTASNWLLESASFTIDDAVAGIFNNTFAAGGDITVRTIDKAVYAPGEGSLTVSSGNLDVLSRKLTLSAYGNVFIDNNIGGAGQLVMRADQTGTGSGQVLVDGFLGSNDVTTYSNLANYSDFGNYAFTISSATGGTAKTFALVNTYADLNRMGQSTIANYALGRDIDASASSSVAYNVTDLSTRTFDGLGHSITGLTISQSGTDNVGLFGTVYNSTISNVHLVGGSVTGRDGVGAIAGRLDESELRASSSSAAVSGANKVGGLVGWGDNSGISDGVASGSVTATGDSVGGLAGNGLSFRLRNNLAAGSVTGDSNVGGLIGVLTGGESDGDTATGNVTGGFSTGGLIGLARDDSSGTITTIDGASARGNVVATSNYTGGLVGFLLASRIGGGSHASGTVAGTLSVGGLAGYVSSGLVENSYATGSVTGTSDGVGGLIGVGNGNVDNSYATGNVAGQSSVGGLIGRLFGTASIAQSSATGSVTGHGYVGGLVGYGEDAATIGTSYADGAVSQSSATPGSFFGGLVGYWFASGNIEQSYATGAVFAPTGLAVGGLIGGLENGSVADVYATGSVTGDDIVGGLVGNVRPISAATIQNAYSSGGVTGTTAGASIGQINTSDYGAPVTLSKVYFDTGTSLQSSGVGYASVGFGTITGAPIGLTTTDAFNASSYAFSDPTRWVQLSGRTRPMLAMEVPVADLYGMRTINNIHQLQLVSLNLGDSYVLGRDISAAQTQGLAGSVFGVGGFVPIGLDYGTFTGSLDGQGHQITGLTINRNLGSVGLFDNLTGATLRDFALIGGRISNGARQQEGSIGSIAGDTYGDTPNGVVNTIEDVFSSAEVVGNGYGHVGGLFGTLQDTRLSRSGYAGSVTGRFDRVFFTGTLNVGGLAGSTYQADVRDSYVSGLVAQTVAPGSGANPSLNIGGLIGRAGGTNAFQGVLTTAAVFGTATASSGILIGATEDNTDVTLTSARYSTSAFTSGVTLGLSGTGGSFTETDVAGFTGVQLQDATTLAAVYGPGFDFDTIWAPASGASASSDGQGHFAELYRANNILFVDGRGNTSVYGDTPDASNLTYRGNFRDGDTVTRDAIALTSVTGTTNVGSYAATVTGGSAQRLDGGASRVIRLADITVTPRTLTAMLNAGVTRAYDATTAIALGGTNFTLSGLVNGDTVTGSGTGTFNSANVLDANTVTATNLMLNGAAASNYVLATSTLTGAGTITPATVTASLGGTARRTYDGTTAAPITNLTVGLTGVYGSEAVTAAATSASYDKRDAGTGKTVTATVGLGGAGAGNYVLASTLVSGSIGQIDRAILTALLSGPVSKVYDATTTATLAGSNLALTGVVSGDTVTLGAGGATYADANAGTSKAVTATGLTLSGSGAGNYALASTSVTANIGTVARRELQATLTGTTSRTYDATTTAALLAGNYALAGVLAGDSVALNSPTTGTYASPNVGTGLTVTATGLALTGASAGNYTVNGSASGAIGTINAKVLTAALTGTTSRTYDGTTTAALAGSNYSLSGVVAGDTVTLNNPTVGSYADANAGTGKTVSVNGLALTGASAANYTVNDSASGAIGTINAKVLTAALTGTTSRTYDGTTTATLAGSNYSLSGVVAGDTVTLNNPTVGSYADRNAGTGKTVTATGLALTGASAGNYTVNGSASGAIGTINAKVLTAALTGTTSRTYDGTTTAALAGSNYSLSGVVAGDTVTLNNPTVGSYADRNAGTGKTVTSTGLALSGTGASNYVLASTTASGAIGTITPRGITITADAKAKNRNDADPALTSSITTGSLVQGDSLIGALSRAPGEAVGTYAINQGTLGAGTNYSVTFNGATFTINLGIPPFDDSLFPVIPVSDGSGAGVVSGGVQADVTGSTPGLGFVEEASLEADGEGEASLDQLCPSDQNCPVAPYPTSGFTSASIRFEGYSR